MCDPTLSQGRAPWSPLPPFLHRNPEDGPTKAGPPGGVAHKRGVRLAPRDRGALLEGSPGRQQLTAVVGERPWGLEPVRRSPRRTTRARGFEEERRGERASVAR